MRPIARSVALLLLLLLLLPARVAQAQNLPGNAFSLQVFRPALDSKGYVTVDATELLGHLDFSLGLVSSFAHNVLQLTRGSSVNRFAVEELLTPQLQAALGLFKWAEVGVSLPVHILFGSRAPAFVDPGGEHDLNDDLHFSGQSLGDIGLHLKARLLNPSKHPIGLGASFSLYVPSGDARKLLGEGQVTLRPQLIVDKELGWGRRVKLALNLGVLVRTAKHSFTDVGATLALIPDVGGGGAFCAPAAPGAFPAPADPTCGTQQTRALGSQLTYGLGLAFAVVPQRFELIGEAFGYVEVTGEATGHPLEGLLAAKVYLAAKSYFTLGGGAGLLPRSITASSKRLAMFRFFFFFFLLFLLGSVGLAKRWVSAGKISVRSVMPKSRLAAMIGAQENEGFEFPAGG